MNNKFHVIWFVFTEMRQNDRHTNDDGQFGVKCQICTLNYVAVCLQPCKHFILCLNCAITLLRQCVLGLQFKCPLCRSIVKKIEFPYMPARVDTGKHFN